MSNITIRNDIPIERVSPIEPSLPPLIQTPHYVPRREFPTLSKSKRPELASPDSLKLQNNDVQTFSSMIATLSRMMEKADQTEEIYLKALESTTDVVTDAYNRYTEKHIEEEKKIRDEIKDQEWWDFLRQVGVTLIGAASIIIGGMQISQGHVLPGSLLVGSGACSLIGNTLIDMRKHPHAAVALTLASTAFSLSGSILTLLSGSVQTKDIISQVFVTFLGVTANISSALSEYHASKVSRLRGDYTLTEKEITSLNHHMERLETTFQHSGEAARQLHDDCVRAAYLQRQAIQKIISYSGAA